MIILISFKITLSITFIIITTTITTIAQQKKDLTEMEIVKTCNCSLAHFLASVTATLITVAGYRHSAFTITTTATTTDSDAVATVNYIFN